MADDKKKRGGFLKRAFGLKSKEDKLAEAAAEKAAQQKLVDEQMAARMAAINAAALKSAREQDAAATGVTVDVEETARIEAAEKRKAEIQAAKDVERAKQLAEETARREEAAAKQAELEAKQAAEAKVRAEALAKQEAEAQAAREAEEKQRLEAEAKLKAEEAAALERAKAEQGEREAAALKAKQEAEAAERAAKLEAEKRAAERAALEAQDQARAEEAARLEAERIAAEKLREKQMRLEAEEADRRALEAQKRAEFEAAQREREAEAAAARAALNPEPEIDTLAETGFFSRITKGLSKSTGKMSEGLSTMFNKRTLDDEALEELEDLLIASDLGIGAATQVTAALAKDKFDKQVTDMEVKIALADVISDILTPLERPIVLTDTKPQIMLFVGVNGSGKTTTLGKIAKRYTDQGKKVLLCAGDTFRAAAVEQLTIWGERSGAPVVSGKPGADAAGLVYDAISRAKSEDYDILMIDTAGRLQNRTELMDELYKVVRVIKKQDETAPHHSILVLDATVGQNALMQTEAFAKTAGVTGLIMTKLDGTAKGGVLVALSDKYKLPIHHIGIGERIEDLENFSAPVFAAALSGVADAMAQG